MRAGTFHKDKISDADKPVYEVELKPEDGLYPLPYMARQADGSAWEEECPVPLGVLQRQGFYPDGSRSFEEIDRTQIGVDGVVNEISAQADVDFFRSLPPAGFTKGVPKAQARRYRRWRHRARGARASNFFAYKPFHMSTTPPRPALAKAANDMQALMSSGKYDGAIWTQGSPQMEECAYWFNLLIDTTLPICCNSAQRPQGQTSADGPKNLIDSVSFIRSKVWADARAATAAASWPCRSSNSLPRARSTNPTRGRATTAPRAGMAGSSGRSATWAGLTLTYVPVFKHTYLSEMQHDAPARNDQGGGARRGRIAARGRRGSRKTASSWAMPSRQSAS